MIDDGTDHVDPKVREMMSSIAKLLKSQDKLLKKQDETLAVLRRDVRDMEARLARMEERPFRPGTGAGPSSGAWTDHFYAAQREAMAAFQDLADQWFGRGGSGWRPRRRERIHWEPDAGDVQSYDWPVGAAYPAHDDDVDWSDEAEETGADADRGDATGKHGKAEKAGTRETTFGTTTTTWAPRSSERTPGREGEDPSKGPAFGVD